MDELSEITLRPVKATNANDRSVLLALYEQSRECDLSLTGWDRGMRSTFVEHQFTAQTLHYEKNYPNATHEMIVAGDTPVGRLYVDRTGGQIAILDVIVADEFRNRGIGSFIVEKILAEAQESKTSVRIFVETYNPSLQFFTHRGFVITGCENGSFRLEWFPSRNVSEK